MFWLWRRGICRPHVDWPHKWNESYWVVDVEAGLVEDSTRLSELASWKPTGSTVHRNFGRRCVLWVQLPKFSCWGRNHHGAKSRRQNSHVREGINMVQNRGARILMSGKESTWCKPRGPGFSCQRRNQHGATQKRSRNFSLCGTHPETLTRRIS